MGRIPCLDQRLGTELLFVLELDLWSRELTVDTDRTEGVREFCSGTPKWNADNWFVVYRDSDSTLSVGVLEPDEKSFSCSAMRFVFLPTPVESGLQNSLVGRIECLRGGGCKEKAPRDKARLVLSLLTGGWSAAAHWTGCRSVRILRSIRRSMGSTGTAFRKGVETEGISGVFGRNTFKRLRMLADKSSWFSRSCCFTKSIEAAREPERDRADLNKPFSVDTGPLVPLDFGSVLWDVTD